MEEKHTRFFYIIGNYVPYDIKPSGGCALARVETITS